MVLRVLIVFDAEDQPVARRIEQQVVPALEGQGLEPVLACCGQPATPSSKATPAPRVGPDSLLWLSDRIRESNCDVVHGWAAATQLAELAARFQGKPVVSTFPGAPARARGRWDSIQLGPGRRQWIVESEAAAGCTDPHTRSEVMVLQPPAGPPARGGSLRGELGMPTDAVVLASVAPLLPPVRGRTRVATLCDVLDTWASLPGRGSSWLLLAGLGTGTVAAYGDLLRDRAVRHDLNDRLRVLSGPVDSADVAASCDLMLLGDDPEVAGICLHAAAHGVPVLVPAGSAAAELAAPGCVVPGGDTERLRELLIGLTSDAEWRARLGEQAREQTEHRDVQAWARSTAAIYHSLSSPAARSISLFSVAEAARRAQNLSATRSAAPEPCLRDRRSSTSAAISVSQVGIDDESVDSAWSELQASGCGGPAFTSLAWWKAMREVRQPFGKLTVFVAERKGRVVGLLPTELGFDRRGMRRLGFPGQDWLAPDHSDVVAIPEHALPIAEALVAALTGVPEWDHVHFDGLPMAGPLASALECHRPRRAVRLPVQRYRLPFVQLSTTTRSERQWSKSLRQKVRRGLRDAEAGGGGLSVARDPSEVVDRLATMIDLHDAQFGAASRTFTGPRRRFHLAAARRLAEEDRARIYELAVDDRPEVLIYAFRDGHRLAYYSTGRSASGTIRSPGLVAHGAVIESAADEGLAEYDLLRGEHEFKWRFAVGHRVVQSTSLVRIGPGAAAAATAVLGRAVKRSAAAGLRRSPRGAPHS